MPTETVTAAASLAQQYRSLRQGCGLAADGGREILDVLGEDRARFVHGLVTCEVKQLETGTGAYGFFTSGQGRILADAVVAAAEDRLRLVLPAGRAADIAAHLARYLVADRVEPRPAEALARLVLAGPSAAALLARLVLAGPSPGDAWRHRRIEILGVPAWLQVEALLGTPSYALWVTADRAPALRAALLEAGAAEGLAEVGEAALETVRVEEGRPRFGREFALENLPQETGLEDAVSYTKGCYLGQEIVARIHYRGQASRLLRGLLFDAGEPPPAGTALLYEGRADGAVGSAVWSPRLECLAGLAILHRRAAEPGSELALESGGTARVVELPFARHPAG